MKKVTPNATTTFFYDDWNLVEERIAYADNTSSTIRYYWGKDLSCTLRFGCIPHEGKIDRKLVVLEEARGDSPRRVIFAQL